MVEPSVVGSHPTADLPEAVRRVLDTYAAESDGEPFSAWVEQTPPQRLFNLVTDTDTTKLEADD